MRLWEEIDRIQMDELDPNKFTWKGSVSEKYNERDTYKMLCHGIMATLS
jgi:hypothetical protein